MANFEQIDEARQLLGLGETATLKQIKQAYKKAANNPFGAFLGLKLDVERIAKWQ